MLSLQTQEHTIPKEIILCVYIAAKITVALYWSISMHEIAIKDFFSCTIYAHIKNIPVCYFLKDKHVSY